MFIVRLVRWLKGYVSFTVIGAFAERFLNLVTRAGISIWNISRKGEVITACTVARDYKRLRTPAKKSGIRLRLNNRYGFPFHARKYRKRAGLLLGAAIFIGFILFMSQFIWTIEIFGNVQVSRFEILKALESEGIKVGGYKNNIDVPMAKQRLLLVLNDLSWITINLSGTTAVVEVKERTKEPKMESIDKPCNIIAAKSGQILKMEVSDGTAMVKKGDVVKAGDILVSGIIEDKFANHAFKHAGAKVIAQIQEHRKYNVPLVTEVTRYTGKERTKRLVSLLNTDLPIWFCGSTEFDYQLEATKEQLSLFGIELPITYIEERYREVIQQKVPVTEERAKGAVLLLINKFEKDELKDAKEVSRNIDVKRVSNGYLVEVDLVINVDIAKEQEIQVKNLE